MRQVLRDRRYDASIVAAMEGAGGQLVVMTRANSTSANSNICLFEPERL
jgi:hypothetical protein